MARHSLVLGLAVAFSTTTGCLVTSNPDLTPPPTRGPYLSDFSPATYQVILVKSDPGPPLSRPSVTIGLTLWSDDIGQAPVFVLQRDFQGFGLEGAEARFLRSIGSQQFPSGDFDHPRPMTFTFDLASVSAGCHSVTAIVADAWNFDRTKWQPPDGTRSTSVTWFLDIDDGTGATTVSSCPAASIDGGVDAGRDAAQDGTGTIASSGGGS